MLILRTFVGALLQLLVVGSLLYDIQNSVGQLGVREGIRLRIHGLARHFEFTGRSLSEWLRGKGKWGGDV